MSPVLEKPQGKPQEKPAEELESKEMEIQQLAMYLAEGKLP